MILRDLVYFGEEESSSSSAGPESEECRGDWGLAVLLPVFLWSTWAPFKVHSSGEESLERGTLLLVSGDVNTFASVAGFPMSKLDAGTANDDTCGLGGILCPFV